MLRITHLKWLLSLLIPAGAYFAVQTAVQADPSLNPHLPMFFAITLWAITVWATDILPAVPSAAAMTFFISAVQRGTGAGDFWRMGSIFALDLLWCADP